MVVFDSYPLEEGKYKVILNDSIFSLENIAGYTLFEKWEEHIKRPFIITDRLNPLRKYPLDSAEVIPDLDYNKLSFVVRDIKNDWIFVECNIDCEGCPENIMISGWLKWRKNNDLLVKLFYVC